VLAVHVLPTADIVKTSQQRFAGDGVVDHDDVRRRLRLRRGGAGARSDAQRRRGERRKPND
jgi:hypothetical protein